MAKYKYTFSGHESFYCRSLWLKKGYEFVKSGKNFAEDSAVVSLGVGKNMVSSIRFWMKAFGILEDEKLTDIATFIFNDEDGRDPYLEDVGTAWLLHYQLLSKEIASLYGLCFRCFIRERNGEFSKEQFQSFIKRKCDETGNNLQYNENTVRRDIGVLLQNYVSPTHSTNNEDYSAIFLPLNLIKQAEGKTYYFNYTTKSPIPQEIFYYFLLDSAKDTKAVSFDALMDLALPLCMTKNELVDKLISLTKTHPTEIQYSDNSGIRQLLILRESTKWMSSTITTQSYDIQPIHKYQDNKI